MIYYEQVIVAIRVNGCSRPEAVLFPIPHRTRDPPEQRIQFSVHGTSIENDPSVEYNGIAVL